MKTTAAVLAVCLAVYGYWAHAHMPSARVDLLALQASQGLVLARWQLAMATSAGNVAALRVRGNLALAENTPVAISSGIVLLEQAARLGSAQAALDLGRLHFTGRQTHSADFVAARRWLEQAVVSEPAAAYYLALIEKSGRAGPADPAKSLAYLKNAAAAGIAEAQFLLGNAYADGAAGVERDAAKALDWFGKAAQSEHPGALQALAQALSRGELGLPRDEIQANQLFALAADAQRDYPRHRP